MKHLPIIVRDFFSPCEVGFSVDLTAHGRREKMNNGTLIKGKTVTIRALLTNDQDLTRDMSQSCLNCPRSHLSPLQTNK